MNDRPRSGSTAASSRGVPSVVVCIATAGRPQQAELTVLRLAALHPAPDAIVVAPATPQDFDAAAVDGRLGGIPLQVVTPARKSLTVQRNAILASLPADRYDVVLFLDDDFYPARDYIGQLASLFREDPSLVAVTGRPAVDGISGPGLSHAEAMAVIERLDAAVDAPARVGDTYGTYGCNMGFRHATIQQMGLRFDESLPLYGWLEDIDFSRRLAPQGRICVAAQLRGVHLGVKGGRGSGLRLGYSQVVNPLYCVRKGSMSAGYAWKHVLGNLAMNVTKSVRPEPWVDRVGRLRGNLIGMHDLLRGKAHPMRAVELE